MFKLGDVLKCRITGLEGTAVAKIDYINGCVQYQIQPKGLKDGKIIAADWIDVQQLSIVEQDEQPIKRTRTGGSGAVPPPFAKP